MSLYVDRLERRPTAHAAAPRLPTPRVWGGYLWALPNTLLGLSVGLLTAMTGGQLTLRRGVIEVSGGLATWLLRHATPLAGGAAAMTLGHVILGQGPRDLNRCRDHEHIHVRQYARWGPLFLPAYAASSLVCLLRHQHPYLANRFEREAYGACEFSTASSGDLFIGCG